MPCDKLILISHYNSDLTWVNQLKLPYYIYSKNSKYQNYIDFNKGQEVPMYLKYIIDHYDNLPNKTLFYHDHLNSPHQDFDSIFIANNLNWDLDDYFSVNRREWYQTIDKNSKLEPEGLQWIKTHWFLFENHLPEIDKLVFFSGAQFVVDKKLILQYNKEYYEYLYNWIKQTDVSNYITSRIFEYMWHYIFTKKNIEPFYNNIF